MADEQEREKQETLFRDYVGQALWHITSIQHFKTSEPNDMPQYVELSHPTTIKPETPDQIKQRILNKLGV